MYKNILIILAVLSLVSSSSAFAEQFTLPSGTINAPASKRIYSIGYTTNYTSSGSQITKASNTRVCYITVSLAANEVVEIAMNSYMRGYAHGAIVCTSGTATQLAGSGLYNDFLGNFDYYVWKPVMLKTIFRATTAGNYTFAMQIWQDSGLATYSAYFAVMFMWAEKVTI